MNVFACWRAENLALAKQAAKQGNNAESAHSFAIGVQSAFELWQSSNRHATDANALKQQIDQSMQSSQPVSANQIDGWWNETASWINTGNPVG